MLYHADEKIVRIIIKNTVLLIPGMHDLSAFTFNVRIHAVNP